MNQIPFVNRKNNRKVRIKSSRKTNGTTAQLTWKNQKRCQTHGRVQKVF
jgi:hypothetical protein